LVCLSVFISSHHDGFVFKFPFLFCPIFQANHRSIPGFPKARRYRNSIEMTDPSPFSCDFSADMRLWPSFWRGGSQNVRTLHFGSNLYKYKPSSGKCMINKGHRVVKLESSLRDGKIPRFLTKARSPFTNFSSWFGNHYLSELSIYCVCIL